jgi:hypothetical protein
MFQKLEKKVQNQKRQLAALQAARTTADSGVDEPMKGDSDSDSGSRKHLAIMRQGSVPRKAGCSGRDSYVW